jgi:hypothetical protein
VLRGLTCIPFMSFIFDFTAVSTLAAFPFVAVLTDRTTVQALFTVCTPIMIFVTGFPAKLAFAAIPFIFMGILSDLSAFCTFFAVISPVMNILYALGAFAAIPTVRRLSLFPALRTLLAVIAPVMLFISDLLALGAFAAIPIMKPKHTGYSHASYGLLSINAALYLHFAGVKIIFDALILEFPWCLSLCTLHLEAKSVFRRSGWKLLGVSVCWPKVMPVTSEFAVLSVQHNDIH